MAGYSKTLMLKPNLAGVHHNLGNALWQQGRLEEAEASYRRALALQPDLASAQNNLGTILLERNRLNEAVAVYRQLVRVAPENIKALNGLASALIGLGNATEALETILKSLRLGETREAKRAFIEAVKRVRWTKDHAEARGGMTRALTEAWARPGEISRAAAELVKQGVHLGASVTAAAIAWPRTLSASELYGSGGTALTVQDPLLLALLVSAQNTDIELERFLTLARRVLLDAAVADQATTALGFYAALARQCFINEYVFFRDEKEIQRADRLCETVAKALKAGTPVSPLQLLGVAAYFPLHTLAHAQRLMDRTWPDEVGAVLMQQVREPLEEAKLRAAIPRLTPVSDGVSRLVQEQYEENPYPRWVRMAPAGEMLSIPDYLRQKFPFAVLQEHDTGARVEFLSAGCGTGQLPLEIARSVAARVTAIDLSLSSLAYAQRKAQECGLTDIEFAQADLQALQALGRSFDVVECSGVLHHLADPFGGWRALLPLVRPGGLMLIGLYSEMARHGVNDARRFIAERGYGASADAIRHCRQDLLELDRYRDVIARFGDFFGMSTCRDLLFHVQEQQMRLPAIAEFLRENGLSFLGFEADPHIHQAYRRRFPDDPAATDLDKWAAFENDNPDTFSGMYVFWTQKDNPARFSRR